ncbi:MAG TPA: hypothetical protein VF763_01950 [Candidatus Limnocylindrales bacterium]
MDELPYDPTRPADPTEVGLDETADPSSDAGGDRGTGAERGSSLTGFAPDESRGSGGTGSTDLSSGAVRGGMPDVDGRRERADAQRERDFQGVEGDLGMGPDASGTIRGL